MTTVEVLVLDDPEVLGRIVRVVSTQPFALEMLHYRRTPGSRKRLVLMDVVVSCGADLLTKRLNRIVSVQRVRLVGDEEVLRQRHNVDHGR